MAEFGIIHLTDAARNLEERGTLKNILCARCSNGMVFRRAGQLRPVAFCRVSRCEVPTDLVECSAFEDPKELELWQMNEIALEVDKRIPGGQYA